MKTSTKTNQYSASNFLMYWPLTGTLLCLALLLITTYAVIPLFYFMFMLFHGSLNILQVAGPVYWIYKDKAPYGTPMLSWGFMHETSEPWRVGRGIQIRCGDKSFQVGLCRRQNYSETEGTLSAVRGRFLDWTPTEIREHSEKGNKNNGPVEQD